MVAQPLRLPIGAHPKFLWATADATCRRQSRARHRCGGGLPRVRESSSAARFRGLETPVSCLTVLDFDQLCRRAAASGLAVRGAFHPEPGELGVMPGERPGTVVLLGFTGSSQWSAFQDSREARDGLPHPLDRWSQRVIGALASELGATDFYPSGSSSSPLPFQRLARRCEPVHPSPIGLLIHPTYGLWHAYRGGLLLAERIALPHSTPRSSPCERCADRPCLSACPARAFRAGSFDLDACVSHVLSAAGAECRDNGCLARRACPVGPEFRYVPSQARFHMSAFLRSIAASS